MKYFCVLLMGVFVVSAAAQKNTPQITSVYTNLTTNCREIRGGAGQDSASDCKGVAGYRIYFSPAAAMQSISATVPDKDRTSIPLVNQQYDYNERKIKVEWRLSGGKPFAVILRVNKYDGNNDGTNYLGKKIGEQLIVRGLKGFEDISGEVDANVAGANAKAREIADKGFTAAKK